MLQVIRVTGERLSADANDSSCLHTDCLNGTTEALSRGYICFLNSTSNKLYKADTFSL